MKPVGYTVREAMEQDTPPLFIDTRQGYQRVIDFETDDLETRNVICIIVKNGNYYAMRAGARPFYVDTPRSKINDR